MAFSWKRPTIPEVQIEDRFWTPYLEKIRTVTLPYVFQKFEETNYLQNFLDVATQNGAKHKGPPFSDGLVLESIRGACDFLASQYDPELDALLDRVIAMICDAADADPNGYLCTQTTQDYPHLRWGENGGSIIVQHDLYDHGALVEAAVSHYLATGKTTLLSRAVRAANYICSLIGPPPKKNIVPGHSLPEEAFLKLYRLFRDTRALDSLAAEWNVNAEEYFRIVQFWYDWRGTREKPDPNPRFTPEYNQDHLPFANQTKAVGHSVRAMLCYTGAAALTYETGDPDYRKALNTLWENVVFRKMHISGGVGTRHDIEGFDTDYNLPNNAYLETCAGIALAFWNGEMSLLHPDSRYFDVFERALCNNVLASVGDDFTHYFYQNPLVSDGTIHRWEWHGCPCCPPMLLKLYGALGTYLYSYSDEEQVLNINLFIGSRFQHGALSVQLSDNTLTLDTHGKAWSIHLRLPEYADDFHIFLGDNELEFDEKDGYATLPSRIWSGESLRLVFDIQPHRIYANPAVEDDRGMVAITYGPYVYCAEGIDNNGNVDLVLPENPRLCYTNDAITGTAADGSQFRLIPYYRWCNRVGGAPTDSKMAVWFRQEGWNADTLTQEITELSEYLGELLYLRYD